MSNLYVGSVHQMTVREVSEQGYLLTKGTEKAILPRDAVDEKLVEDALVDVFLYHDKRGNLLATTRLPQVMKGLFGWVEVIREVRDLGVFVDIGGNIEVLVSADDLPAFKSAWPVAGDTLYVTLTTDKKNRLLAVPASERDFSDLFAFAYEVELNDRVSGTIIRTAREGAVIITDEQQYRAFIHHSEREKEPRLGEKVEGRVIEVKEDGTLNVSLLPLKHERLDSDSEQILAYLNEAGGEIPFGDKSDPEAIKETFQMSKSAFKRALGRLMREGKIEQRDGKTYLK